MLRNGDNNILMGPAAHQGGFNNMYSKNIVPPNELIIYNIKDRALSLRYFWTQMIAFPQQVAVVLEIHKALEHILAR